MSKWLKKSMPGLTDYVELSVGGFLLRLSSIKSQSLPYGGCYLYNQVKFPFHK